MVKGDSSLSGEDTDSSSNDFHWNEKRALEPGIVQREWEAVERNLYQEDDTPTVLKSTILHECRMWKESFPYLRVRGQRIENPLAQRRQHLKQQILSLIVDQIIFKLNDGVLSVQDEQIQVQNNEESYFERGKNTMAKTSPVYTPALLEGSDKKLSLGAKISDSMSPSLDANKTPPRGILKNSPSRRKAAKKTHERKTYKDSTSQNSFRSSSLPRISAKSNNWLTRSEKHIPNASQTSNRRLLPSQNENSRRKPCTCGGLKSQFMLPPIKTPTEFKKI